MQLEKGHEEERERWRGGGSYKKYCTDLCGTAKSANSKLKLGESSWQFGCRRSAAGSASSATTLLSSYPPLPSPGRPKGKLIKLKILAATCINKKCKKKGKWTRKRKTQTQAEPSWTGIRCCCSTALLSPPSLSLHAPQLKCYRYCHFDGLQGLHRRVCAMQGRLKFAIAVSTT